MEATKEAVEVNFNETHPERRSGEFWLRNVREEDYPREELVAHERGQVIRMGLAAYDPDGKPLTVIGMGMSTFRPIFLTGERCPGVPGKVMHPECLSDEACIGNYTLAGFQTLPYAYKRMGRKAYDIEGRLVLAAGDDLTDVFPVFVKIAEYTKNQL